MYEKPGPGPSFPPVFGSAGQYPALPKAGLANGHAQGMPGVGPSAMPFVNAPQLQVREGEQDRSGMKRLYSRAFEEGPQPSHLPANATEPNWSESEERQKKCPKTKDGTSRDFPLRAPHVPPPVWIATAPPVADTRTSATAPALQDAPSVDGTEDDPCVRAEEIRREVERLTDVTRANDADVRKLAGDWLKWKCKDAPCLFIYMEGWKILAQHFARGRPAAADFSAMNIFTWGLRNLQSLLTGKLKREGLTEELRASMRDRAKEWIFHSGTASEFLECAHEVYKYKESRRKDDDRLNPALNALKELGMVSKLTILSQRERQAPLPELTWSRRLDELSRVVQTNRPIAAAALASGKPALASEQLQPTTTTTTTTQAITTTTTTSTSTSTSTSTGAAVGAMLQIPALSNFYDPLYEDSAIAQQIEALVQLTNSEDAVALNNAMSWLSWPFLSEKALVIYVEGWKILTQHIAWRESGLQVDAGMIIFAAGIRHMGNLCALPPANFSARVPIKLRLAMKSLAARLVLNEGTSAVVLSYANKVGQYRQAHENPSTTITTPLGCALYGIKTLSLLSTVCTLDLRRGDTPAAQRDWNERLAYLCDAEQRQRLINAGLTGAVASYATAPAKIRAGIATSQASRAATATDPTWATSSDLTGFSQGLFPENEFRDYAFTMEEIMERCAPLVGDFLRPGDSSCTPYPDHGERLSTPTRDALPPADLPVGENQFGPGDDMAFAPPSDLNFMRFFNDHEEPDPGESGDSGWS